MVLFAKIAGLEWANFIKSKYRPPPTYKSVSRGCGHSANVVRDLSIR